jgi:polyisoprenoid-binding protein YceI
MSVIDEAKSTHALPAGRWSIDPAHSSVGFAIKHMALKTLRGRFHDFEGSLDLSNGEPSASGAVRAASIDTGESIRDQHLRESADFFDVEHHPEIRFSSTRVLAQDRGRLRVEGDLSMRGQTRPIVLEGQLNENPLEGRIEMELRGELPRKDFGLTWNQALDAGGALLGNKVKIELRLSALA